MSPDTWKRQAAQRALDMVQPGMRLGLGTGSTAAHFVELLGARVRDGLDVLCVPTSERTHTQARTLGIPLTTLDDTPRLHLTVDGADELDEDLRLIKGGGGALLREKIVAVASERMVVIADRTKLVPTLGTFPLPVEVVRFGQASTAELITELSAEVGCSGRIVLRTGADGQPVVTDGGNYIFDCAFGRIEDPEALDAALKAIPGVVENGLFIGIATAAVVAGADGLTVLGDVS